MLRGLWQPLLISAVATPLIVHSPGWTSALTVSLVSASLCVLAYGYQERQRPTGTAFLSRACLLAAIAAALALAGAVDVATGYAIDITALYFVPIALAAWRMGPVAAAVTVILAESIWLGTHLWMRGTVTLAVVLWNAEMKLITFAVLALVVRGLGKRAPVDAPIAAREPVPREPPGPAMLQRR